MTESMVTAWNVVLKCGKELHGSEIGSFTNVKNRDDIIDLYVNTGAGKVFAAKPEGEKVKFDFFVAVALEDTMKTEKKWKLVTICRNYKLIKYVLPDGRNWIEKEG